MLGGAGEELGQMGWFRLWRDSNTHQRLKKRFEPDEVSDGGGVLRKSNLVARY